MTRGRMSLIACKSGKYFADRVLAALAGHNVRLVQTSEQAFSNGEVKVVINDCIRGDDVYIFQCVEDPSGTGSINDRFMTLLTALDAARRSDAKHITTVLLPFPYARQEKQGDREAITAAIVARMLEEFGSNNVMTVDVHADAIAGFFNRAIFFNLYAMDTLLAHFKKQNAVLDNLVVVSPDVGGAKRARYYAKTLRVPLALVNKERDYSQISKVEKVTLIGDVAGKDVLIVDDMVDTGGTVYNVAKMLKQEGAGKISVMCSHALLNGPGKQRMQELFDLGILSKFYCTDTVLHSSSVWLEQVSIAPFIAKVMKNINEEQSVSFVN